MDDLLLPIHSVKKIQSNIDKFESLSLSEDSHIRPSSSKSKRPILEIISTSSETTDESLGFKPSAATPQTSTASHASYKKHKRYDSTAFLQKSYLSDSPSARLPDDAREILRSQPEPEDLQAVLSYLQYGIDGKHDFNVHVAGPQASQIISAVVTKIIPDYWPLYRQSGISKSESKGRELILSMLRSVPGIGALLLHLRQLSSSGIQHKGVLQETASALAWVVGGSSTIQLLLRDTLTLYTRQPMRRAVWQEVVALFAGSKILSTVSQALRSTDADEHKDIIFLIDGTLYNQWLARNISTIIIRLAPTDSEACTMVSQMAKRGLSLGYRDAFVSELCKALLLGPKALWTPLRQLVQALSSSEQRAFFDAMLRDLTRKYLRTGLTVDSLSLNGLESDNAIGGVASMITGLVEGNPVLAEHLVRWLSSTNGEYATLGLDTRRAVIATLALRKEKLHYILEQCLESFGDKTQIQHSPILQQESLAATLLLIAGYLHRLDTGLVKDLSKQGVFLQTTSNRLAASVPRVRFLGMIFATAVSRLVDTPDKAMNFGVDELEDESAQKWFSLVDINDTVGSIEDLRYQGNKAVIELIDDLPKKSNSRHKKSIKPAPKTTSKIISIEEIDDDNHEDEEDDPEFVPYAKPDSDPSDSDDDPTLIDRSKPSAPVYIIDLITQLSTYDKPEMVSLALRSAPSLIRRKANFGTELSENATPLASALINLRDGMHQQDSHQLRLQGLIACLASCPKIIGPWAAALYFDGDMSLDQRASLLSMLGLGARELSGYNDSTSSTLSEDQQDQGQIQDRDQDEPFPSRRLPPHLATIYAPTETIARQLTHSTIQPMALAAADKVTGPDILKIRTFSSRMEVERKRDAKQAERSKRIPKDLHKTLAQSIYLPLCCRLSLVLSSSSSSSHHDNINSRIGRSNIFEPGIVRLFLQTLTIVLVCLGPNALQLGEVTRETLVLLTAVHNVPKLALDAVVLPALLQLLLTTLDLNVSAGAVAEERLITDFGALVAQLVRWADGLQRSVSVPAVVMEEGEGGMPWNVLVAGIQVKWHEVGRKYQGRMLGLMGGEVDQF